MAKQEREVERWITANGVRVPIFKDGSVGGSKAFQEAYKKKAQSKNTKSFHENTAVDGTPIITEYTKLKDVLDAGYTMVDGMTWEPITDKLTDSQVRSKFEGGEIGFIKKTKKAKQINKDDGSKERLSTYERQLAEVNDELANAPKSKALRNEEGIKELEKKKAQLEGYIAKEKGTKKSEANKKVPEHITSAKNMSELNDKLKAQGLSMESADSSAIKHDYKSMNGEKVSLYDKDGNEYKGTFNRYSDGGTEIVDIKKTKDSPKKVANDNEDLKEKQIKQNEAERQKLNGKDVYQKGTKVNVRSDYGEDLGESTIVRKLKDNEIPGSFNKNAPGGYYEVENTREGSMFKGEKSVVWAGKISNIEPKKLDTLSPKAQARKMTESELRAYVKKNNLTKSYNMMMNTRPGAYGYEKQMSVLRDLVADNIAVQEAKKRKKK